MQKLPISYFDANTNGSLMSYFTNDIEATNELLQHSHHADAHLRHLAARARSP